MVWEGLGCVEPCIVEEPRLTVIQHSMNTAVELGVTRVLGRELLIPSVSNCISSQYLG